MINVFLLAFLFWIAGIAVRRSGHPFISKYARVLLIICLFVPLNGFLATQEIEFSLITPFDQLNHSDKLILLSLGLVFTVLIIAEWRYTAIGAGIVIPAFLLGKIDVTIILLVVILLAIAPLIVWYGNHAHQATCAFLLILSPLILINFSQALWMMGNLNSTPGPQPVESASKNRLLWIVFDEMDQNLCFDNRPDSVKLVEIDKLRDQAIYASRAYPPSDYTLLSLPSLITGRFVSSCEPRTPSKMMLTFEGSSDKVDWRSQPNIFSNARQLGINTALVGWYHPYNRVLSENLTDCSHHYLSSRSVLNCMYEQILDLTNLIPFASHFNLFNVTEKKRLLRREYHLSDFTRILEDAKRVASDPKFGLILLHFPIPHLPAIYDRQSGEMTTERGKSYLDNLELADKTIGELRQRMEEAGTWDRTTVLVTSDHWWRADQWCCIKAHTQHAWTSEDKDTFENHLEGKIDRRVPFLLKLAWQKQRADYENEFNTVLTQELLLSLLKEEISDQKSVFDWIDTYRSIGESPYTFGQMNSGQ